MPASPRLSTLPINGLEKFSIGSSFLEEGTQKKITIVDYDAGSLPIGRGLHLPPSVLIEIETLNPDYVESSIATEAINNTANMVREALGLVKIQLVTPPSKTLKQNANVGVTEFLQLTEGLKQL